MTQWIMRKCSKCGRYTLRKDKCPICGGRLIVPHPPKYSPVDKYLKYRYLAKKQAGIIA